MTPQKPPGSHDQVRHATRAGLALCVTLLGLGLVIALAGVTSGTALLILGLLVLLGLPVLNVLGALMEEIERRDWAFVGAAVAVLAILAYNVYRSVT